MPEGQISFDLGTAVLSQYDADGFLGISIDHYGDSAGGPPAESHNAFGFLGRPSDPDVDVTTATPTTGCTVWYYREGKRYGAIAMSDPRHLPPQVNKGGSVQYCSVAGAYAKFDGSTGAYSVAVPSGQSMTLQAAGGPAIVHDSNGITVGGNLAQAVALGSAVNTLISSLLTFATGLCPPNAVMSTSAAFIAQLQALKQIQTSMLKGVSD